MGKGPDAGLAALLECLGALGVPRWVYFFLIQEASMQGTSCDLVVTWHSAHTLGCWETTRTTVTVLPLGLPSPHFSHIQKVPHKSKCLLLPRNPERGVVGS